VVLPKLVLQRSKQLVAIAGGGIGTAGGLGRAAALLLPTSTAVAGRPEAVTWMG